MAYHWNDSQPIYLQLAEQIKDLILNDDVGTGEALPSVRQLAVDYQVNPITVSKSYQILVDEALVEKKRGLGMFVSSNAKNILKQEQRQAFINHQWPQVLQKIEQLDIDIDSLIESLKDTGSQS
ncbi:GntR family transcriptional regulator [Marinicella gelatinilytica]|uniref:GntR family transcriptional regulator n=1 Tax=Marinicella gelatinilytica TaxID=2996017 RepID=UPI002260C851|nr:GntR family transcriptional regulator [Marinicella gelatinilytica]MCX7544451.1 GntR family transcriptional regulator [Marinicella gelatinilytica]